MLILQVYHRDVPFGWNEDRNCYEQTELEVVPDDDWYDQQAEEARLIADHLNDWGF